jgi:hypothetical protein
MLVTRPKIFNKYNREIRGIYEHKILFKFTKPNYAGFP